MLLKTNIQERLVKLREKRISEVNILAEVQQILDENELHRIEIKSRLESKKPTIQNNLNPLYLDASRIFHITDIKKLCVDYRLRFLDAHYFKGDFPEQAISEIRMLEQQHACSFQDFKIVAPAKLLKLENADDPLLFVPINDQYFYLIHKWGRDLHPLRRFLMWPYKTFENLVFAVFVVSLLLTAITPFQLFTKGEVAMQEYVLMFLFMFKAVGGIVLYYGFAKGKNFNIAIWNSKYYNA